MFFNQSLVNFRLTARETLNTPILSAVLYIDKNIANKTAIELDILRLYFRSEKVLYYFYYNDFNTPRVRFQAGRFNGSRSLVFDASSNSSECFAGTRTFVMVPVKVYVLSLVGTIRITVFANTRDLSVNRNPYYVDAEGLVDSGKDITILYKISSMYIITSAWLS